MEPSSKAKNSSRHPDDLPANLDTRDAELQFEKEVEEEQSKIIRETQSEEHDSKWWHVFSWKPTKYAGSNIGWQMADAWISVT